jgi:predicted ABC-type ATPase
MPNLYIIAGCNGAGKTTASMTVLPEILNCYEFVNADEIARGLSPFQPEKVAIEAGRIMLNRLNQLIESGVDFAFETTLSTKSYVSYIKKAKESGYKVTLIFIFLKSDTLAKLRVKTRVLRGGHNIEENVVERRYKAGLKNFFQLYTPICDFWLLVDNSSENFELNEIASGESENTKLVLDNNLWNQINLNHGNIEEGKC